MKGLFSFRKFSTLQVCILLGWQVAFAAEVGDEFVWGEISQVIVILVLLVFTVFFFYSRKQQKRLLDQVEGLEKKNEELLSKTAKQAEAISTLNGNKKELEHFLNQKIKENDTIRCDITDKLAEAERQVKNAEHIHDRFFIETIHEMRTSLSLVLGSLALVVQNNDSRKDLSAQLLSAYRNTLAMQDLADLLIGVQRTNDVSNYLRIARYDMVDLARQSCDLFVDRIAMNRVDFRINTQTDVLWVWLDRRKIEFILRVLLTNAFRNTFFYGKVTLNISVVREEGIAYCSLVLKDESLDEEDNMRRGLKQILNLVNDMGGIYRSNSDQNNTSYSVLIPLGKQYLLDRCVEFAEPEADLVKLTDSQKEEISELIQIVSHKKTAEVGKTLLVIDDSDQIRWFLRHVFNKEYNILEARNGLEGVVVAFREEPDLVLCDVMMPIQDGFATCKKIKSNPRTSQIPVVMLTDRAESEDVITGIEAGADDYITKPFDVEILHSKINSLMKKRDQMEYS